MNFGTIFFICVECVFIHFCGGENCTTLVGTWYNELGSQLTLAQSGDGTLNGTYVMGDGTSNGYSLVTGVAATDSPGVILSFRIISNDGAFTKAWIGQCLVCSGTEMLVTTWLLRRSVVGCPPNWRSTNVGESVFLRNQASPLHDCPRGKEIPINATDSDATGCPTSSPEGGPCPLDGLWYNELGSQVNLTVTGMFISGTYHTAVESSQGASGGGYSKVFGVTVPGRNGSTMAMNVIWNNGTSATLWIGQCHLCGANQTILTSWILRSKITSCIDNWMAARYGQDYFTRFPQVSVTNPQTYTTPATVDQSAIGAGSSLPRCYKHHEFILMVVLYFMTCSR